ncbi:MAG: hypothetical protein AAF600_12765 [Bacteroidota bacterium]
MIRISYLPLVVLAFLLFYCSDFDEVKFTVLQPDAGEDFLFFTSESGTQIPLDGSASTDVNNLGFTYSWEIATSPDGTNPLIQDANSATPTITVDEGISGRITVSMIIARGDQQARDFVNIDVNPQIANVLLVNGVDSDESAKLRIPSASIIGSEVTALSTDNTYYDINLSQNADVDGNIMIEVDFNGATFSAMQSMQALQSYTIYLVGSLETPELLIIAKRYNQNTIQQGLVGLDAINLSTIVSGMVLFIDATPVGFTILPIDVLFGSLGVTEALGSLDFKDNAELLFPTASIFPIPIWATVDGKRVSNDVNITLNNTDEGQFGTFILYKDASAEFGNTLAFINNSALLTP